MLSAFRARYPDEGAISSRGSSRSRTTCARAAATRWSSSSHARPTRSFATASELYHHFLIDVELEGCARTTRVAAAIGAVQLYVHRILLNLEQDGRDLADPARVHVRALDGSRPTSGPGGATTGCGRPTARSS